MTTGPADAAPGRVARARATLGDPAPTRSVGGYRLLSRIGEGGMGVVHLARREDDPDADPVALKLLRPHVVGDDEARARLEREVGSLGRVRSRWVAEIVDADPWGPVPFVATRYVPGLSLHDLLAQEGPVRGRDLLWLAGCLAEGVAAVHAAGVLHRDVKPSNVLMEGRTPILIDFGLARVADDLRLTRTGWLLGTPGYLAPEILYGDDATPASDVHSWAATVGCAATGSTPFGAGPAMALMDRVRRGQHDLEGVEEPLRTVLAAALDPEPRRRPTLAELLDWLRPQSTRPHEPAHPPPTVVARAVTVGREGPVADAATAPERPSAREPTRVLGDAPGHPERPRAPDQRERGPAPPVWEPWVDPGPTRGERTRRAALPVLIGLVVVLAVAGWPWGASVLAVAGAGVARGWSSAADARDERRRWRGRRWHDGPRLLAGVPWHVLRTLPGSVLLGLVALAGAGAAWLLGVTADLGPVPPLGLAGAGLVAGLWLGPGGGRLRSATDRAATSLAARTRTWAAVALALALLGTGLVVTGPDRPDWGPVGRPSLEDLPGALDLR